MNSIINNGPGRKTYEGIRYYKYLGSIWDKGGREFVMDRYLYGNDEERYFAIIAMISMHIDGIMSNKSEFDEFIKLASGDSNESISSLAECYLKNQ